MNIQKPFRQKIHICIILAHFSAVQILLQGIIQHLEVFIPITFRFGSFINLKIALPYGFNSHLEIVMRDNKDTLYPGTKN